MNTPQKKKKKRGKVIHKAQTGFMQNVLQGRVISKPIRARTNFRHMRPKEELIFLPEPLVELKEIRTI